MGAHLAAWARDALEPHLSLTKIIGVLVLREPLIHSNTKPSSNHHQTIMRSYLIMLTFALTFRGLAEHDARAYDPRPLDWSEPERPSVDLSHNTAHMNFDSDVPVLRPGSGACGSSPSALPTRLFTSARFTTTTVPRTSTSTLVFKAASLRARSITLDGSLPDGVDFNTYCGRTNYCKLVEHVR